MTKFAELIERLEKATGPDRELDMAILDAVAGPIERTSRRFVARVPIQEVSGSFIRRKCPPYTASIDAALTLVPAGRETHTLSNMSPDYNDSNWKPNGAVIWVPNQESGIFIYAETPAIALCIAALKAREAQP